MYTPIVAALGFVVSPDGDRVLMVHRPARADDDQHGFYNGLGGKMEPDEDIVACLRRELREEAGLEAASIRLRGTVSWPGFGKHGEDWLGFIFVVDAFEGTPPTRNDEGELSWVPIADIATLPMLEGDRHFMPLVFDDSITQFHGVLPYENLTPLSWSVSVL